MKIARPDQHGSAIYWQLIGFPHTSNLLGEEGLNPYFGLITSCNGQRMYDGDLHAIGWCVGQLELVTQ